MIPPIGPEVKPLGIVAAGDHAHMIFDMCNDDLKDDAADVT